MLLHSLCIYEPVLALVPASGPPLGADEADAIELKYWRASAHYVVGVPNRVSDYGAADMSVFEAIVADTPSAVPAAFNAAVKVFVHKSKVGASLAELTLVGIENAQCRPGDRRTGREHRHRHGAGLRRDGNPVARQA
jgi:hypothetical protein